MPTGQQHGDFNKFLDSVVWSSALPLEHRLASTVRQLFALSVMARS